MVERPGPPNQGWGTILRNHAPDIAAMDLFAVPILGFDLLCASVIIRPDRRELAWIETTANPAAEWIAREISEVFPWDAAPRYLDPRPGWHLRCDGQTPVKGDGYPGPADRTRLSLPKRAMPAG